MATNAVTFNGSTQYGKISSIYSALQGLNGTATFEGWFKQDSSGSGAYSRFFQIGDGTTFAFYVITENATPSTGINFGANYATTNADGYKDTGAFSNDAWFHIAAVFENGAQTKIYIDGTEISYTLRNTPSGAVHDTDSSDLFTIGVDDGETTNFWDGDIGCFRIWDVARTGAEISANKDYYLDPANETGLVLNCNVDEGSGTTLGNDVTGGTDVSLIGTPSWTTGPTLSTKTYPDLTDKTANNNDMDYAGVPTETTSTTPFAGSSTCIDLDDGVSYLFINDADQTGLDITGDFTMEFWVRFNSLPPNTGLGGAMYFGGKRGGSGNYGYRTAIYQTSGTYRLWISLSSNGTSETNKEVTWSTPSVDTWYHIAYVYDASAGEVDVYVDASQVGSTITGMPTSIYDNAAVFNIATINNVASLNVDGMIDEFRMWNTERTSTEISNNYQTELVGNESGLVGYWPFETLGGGASPAPVAPKLGLLGVGS